VSFVRRVALDAVVAQLFLTLTASVEAAAYEEIAL
jgi:hypothetical protein